MEIITNPIDTAIPAANLESSLLLPVADQSTGRQSLTGTGVTEKQRLTAATVREVNAGTLPAVSLDHRESPTTSANAHSAPGHHWYNGTLAVAEDIASGAYHEVTDHPLRVVGSFVIGAGTAP